MNYDDILKYIKENKVNLIFKEKCNRVKFFDFLKTKSGNLCPVGDIFYDDDVYITFYSMDDRHPSDKIMWGNTGGYKPTIVFEEIAGFVELI